MDKTLFRKLTVEDFRRMNLPEAYWKAKLDQVPPSAEPTLRDYIERLDAMRSRGIGLLLIGAPGAGSTSAAAVLAKAAKGRGWSVYFTSILDLRDAMRARETFDDNPVFDRCRDVDFLVLDRLMSDDATAPFIDNRVLTELIKDRGDRKRVTIVTSRVLPSLMAKMFPDFLGTTGPYLVPQEVTGPDRRRVRSEQARDFVNGGSHGR